LNAIETAALRNGPRDRRAVIAHTQLVDPADLPRFAALDVVANFEPLWAQPDVTMTGFTEPRIGPIRSAHQYPIATLSEQGRISFGSDWPVSSADPREGLAVAVTHRAPDGSSEAVWLPKQRVSMETAVRAYTSGVAYQAFEEDAWGTLRVGARADLVHLPEDPRVIDPLRLPQLPVLGTWLAGRRTA
jgi:predicted amidohydrolase YtcJ